MGTRLGQWWVLAVVMPLLSGGLAWAAPADSGATRSTTADSTRRQAIDAFYDVWLRNENMPVGWTGSVGDCSPGRTSEAATAATQGQINYFRTLAGLRSVTLDGNLAGVAQRTALIMDANDRLSHDPPSWWKCHTRAGSDLAARSNLALGSAGAGARAISRYMVDAGHTSVAHRRWVLNPRTAVMAAGSTAAASVLVVVGMPEHQRAVPDWIPWPPAGYVPAPLEPRGVWSLSTTVSRIDLSQARVRVTDESGRRYATKRLPLAAAYGPRTLVWRVNDLRKPSLRRDVTYHVRVTGLVRSGSRMSAVAWSVTMVKPDRPTIAVARPTIRGDFEVGDELVVSPGSWSPTPASRTYQWLRDGAPIAGATYPFYWAAAADEGHLLSARVTAKATYYTPGTVTVHGAVVTP